MVIALLCNVLLYRSLLCSDLLMHHYELHLSFLLCPSVHFSPLLSFLDFPSSPLLIFLALPYPSFVTLSCFTFRTVHVTLFDNKWHHVCFTWKSNWGIWYMFNDGFIIGKGKKFGDLYNFIGKGIIQLKANNLGPSQNSSNVPIAKITNVNIWKDVLRGEEIVEMSYGCSLRRHSLGTLVSWTLLQAIAVISQIAKPVTCLGSSGKFMYII